MKNFLLIFATLTALTSTALAESILCISQDGRMKAEIAESYHNDGSFLTYKLFWIQQDSELIYDTWFYNLAAPQETLILDNYLSVRIYPGGMDVIKAHEGTTALSCKQ